MKFDCSNCGNQLTTDSQQANAAVVCPVCHKHIAAPALVSADTNAGPIPPTLFEKPLAGRPDRPEVASTIAEPIKGDMTGRLLGKCRIECKLGTGGMGAVYLATHTRLDVFVAVKVLPSDSVESRKRFVQEARLAARIRHPNVVTVLDVDQDEDTGQYYIVQEYVAGGSVQELVDSGPVPSDRAMDIAIGVAEALKAASEHNIVHRDIKPGNILLTKDGLPKLADLGLAKSTSEDAGMTTTNCIMGTPAYMAPEQVQSFQSVDARADIYSLGATLYHMVTGKCPFSGSPASILVKHLQEPLPPVRGVNAAVPESVAAVIEKMMRKDPAARYQTASDLVEALKEAKAGAQPVRTGARLALLEGSEPIRVPRPLGAQRVDRRLRGDPHASPVLAAAGASGDKTDVGRTAVRRKWQSLAGIAAAALLAIVGGLLYGKGFLSLPQALSAPPGYRSWAAQGKDATGYWGTNAQGLQFRYIAPGTLNLGTNRVLTTTNGYWIQTTEVTQGQWAAAGMKNRSQFKNGPDYPVEMVDWADCTIFAERLGKGYRLPTGDEWEYACRAGSTATYAFGDSAVQLGEYAWYNANAGGMSHPVGKKSPNAWGLFDMHGNVLDWVLDDRTGPDRMYCGGSWQNLAGDCVSAYRARCRATSRFSLLGFRLVWTAPAPAK